MVRSSSAPATHSEHHKSCMYVYQFSSAFSLSLAESDIECCFLIIPIWFYSPLFLPLLSVFVGAWEITNVKEETTLHENEGTPLYQTL